MKVTVEADGGGMSGKSYVLNKIKELLEDNGFTIEFGQHPSRRYHDHFLFAHRPDEWVKENIAKCC